MILKCIRKIDVALRNKIARKRLKTNNFTILCNTCIGGVIYHKLGMQFLSPTINMGFSDRNFFKYINNLDYYSRCTLQFIKSDAKYPVAFLGDIRIDFIHYHSEEEAKTKWEERTRRINKDNLYLICSDRPSGGQDTEITYDDMASLKDYPCKNKIIFTTKDYPDLDYLIHLPKDTDGDFVNVYMNDKTHYLNRWVWEHYFDFVQWLNDGVGK